MYIEEIVEDSLLDDLYSVRTEGLERVFTNKYGEPKSSKQVHKKEEELVSLIEKAVTNIRDYEQIKILLNKFECGCLGEINFWKSLYYKAGVADGMQLKKELQHERDIVLNNKETKNHFFGKNIEEYMLDYIENQKGERLKQNKEYIMLQKEVEEQKQKYPKVQEFFEGGLLDNATKEELKTISKVMELNNQMVIIELQEVFKLGIKEGKGL